MRHATFHSPSPGAAGRSAQARNDLRWVLVAALLGWCLAAAFDLQERIAGLSQSLRLELWQVDELPLVLTVLGGGLAWYAWRRWQETVALLAHNRELALQLIEVQERERLVLARELHDELAQHCTAIRVEAAYLRHADDATALKASAGSISESSRQLLDSLRGILRRLRPVELDELGLEAAVRALASRCAARTGLHCRVESSGELGGLGPSVDMAVYRVAQEALSNVERHAQARRAVLQLRRQGDALELRIEDDGCGFAPDRPSRGLGLLGASERAAQLGGDLSTGASPLGGAALCLRVPVWPVAEGAR